MNNYQQINWESFIDRWILAGSNGTAVYYDINSADKSIGVSTETGENIYLVQRIEKKKIDTTKKYTAVYKKTSGELVIDNNVIFGEMDEAYQLALVIPSGTYLKWACLYEGTYTAETLPPYVPKGYAAELAECQRYFVDVTNGIAPSVLTANGMCLSFLSLPVAIRTGIAPTIIFRNGLYAYAFGETYALTFSNVENQKTGLKFVFTCDSANASCANVPDFNAFISADL